MNRFTALLFTVLVCACSTPQLDSSLQPLKDIPKFSLTNPQDFELGIKKHKSFRGWYPWSLTPNKSLTNYVLKVEQSKLALHAEADASASGLIAPLIPRPITGHELSWEWKALGIVHQADPQQGATDDAPLRLILAFEGDKSKLSLKDQMAFELAQIISGQEMPYATLMYIWSGRKYDDKEILNNKYTSRIKMIAVDYGDEFLGEWRAHRRDIEEDYKRAFNEPPGKLIAIGVLTDTDNTKTFVSAIYGDIEIKPK
jgi:Protein of unknown function (DUF3047)